MSKRGIRHILWLVMLACAVPGAGCEMTPTPTLPIVDAPHDLPPPPWADSLTLTLPPRPSLGMPEIFNYDRQVIYEQSARAFRDGQVLTWWPDGNLGVISLGTAFRFFAANSIHSARTDGSLENPAERVETNAMEINGVDSTEFPYAAGGPVYEDRDSGLLLMFYHAERHFDRSGFPFHAAIGLAASRDRGIHFDNLGIILETNALPDASAPCCADMGGATFAVKDGWFIVYFRDRQADGYEVQLAQATAPVDEVVQAALRGTTSEWDKYYFGHIEPGIRGRSSPLELDNPQTNWFSISHNTALNKFIMTISQAPGSDGRSGLYLAASENGVDWSPRAKVFDYDGELTYPTIIGLDGNSLQSGRTFYIYYVVTPSGGNRWDATALERVNVQLTGRLLEMPHEWEFVANGEGWMPNHANGTYSVSDGVLTVDPIGNDAYLVSPTLGLSTDLYRKIEVRMRSAADGNGQFFFTATDSPEISEEHSAVFPVRASTDFQTYTVDMSGNPAWRRYIGTLRFDPIDQEAHVEIDSIRLVP